MQDVVERLLLIFCTDPLAAPVATEDPATTLATPGNQNRLCVTGTGKNNASPFDLPSGRKTTSSVAQQASLAHTGSPVPRRKERAGILLDGEMCVQTQQEVLSRNQDSR